MQVPLFAAFCCTAALGVLTTGVLLAQICGCHIQPRLPLVTGSILLAVLFVFVTSASAEDLTPRAVVLAWTRLYGHETTKAATLTTERFRKGQRKRFRVAAFVSLCPKGSEGLF